VTDTDDTDRRSRLLGVKLRALVAAHLGRHSLDVEPRSFPHGAALVVDGAAWVLVEGPAAGSLGGALAWAIRNGATSLDLVAEADTGLLARRARRLSFPVRVWFAEERTLLPAVAEPLAPPPPPSSEHLELVAVIHQAGATPNVEHAVVFGEVRGLEVCRVVDQPTTGHIADLDVDTASLAAASGAVDGVQLEVGVGDNDREAFRLLHGDVPTAEALAVVVDAVARHRSIEAPQHPLNRLGRERYLRWELEQDPTRIDMVSVTPAQPPLPRPNLKDPVPCVAAAVAPDGTTRTVVCSVGVDVDLVGFVADVQAMSGDPVVVALRERDAVPITRELLATLATPVELRAVD
jgi:hypothetical protein